MPASRFESDRKNWGPVRTALEHLIGTGEIEADPAQRLLADRLDRLDKDLSATSLATKSSALGWLFGKKSKREPVRGLYQSYITTTLPKTQGQRHA